LQNTKPELGIIEFVRKSFYRLNFVGLIQGKNIFGKFPRVGPDLMDQFQGLYGKCFRGQITHFSYIGIESESKKTDAKIHKTEPIIRDRIKSIFSIIKILGRP
jgi:hypothetical protein